MHASKYGKQRAPKTADKQLVITPPPFDLQVENNKKQSMAKYQVAVVIVSDTVAKDHTGDRVIPALRQALEEDEDGREFEISRTAFVRDSESEIRDAVKGILDDNEWKAGGLILTSGGTGFGDRDVTPEAVGPLLTKSAPGIVHAMLASSLEITPRAALSRPVAGVAGDNRAVIVTLPGSPKGAVENLLAIVSMLPHALDLVGGANSRRLHDSEEAVAEEVADVEHQRRRASSSSAPHHHHCHHQHGHGQAHGHRHGGVKMFEMISNDPSRPVTQRARESPYEMVNVEHALKLVFDNTPLPEMDVRPITDDLSGYVVAEDIVSPTNVPAFRASIVDGYAVVHSDCPRVMPVSVVSHASEKVPGALRPGTVARITTGAPIPAYATAVVPVENTAVDSVTEDGREEKTVAILAKDVKAGDNIREVGSDVARGDTIMHHGTPITSVGGEIGVMASVGVYEVKVFRKPVVGVLSTGAELVEVAPSTHLHGGQIYDSNRPALIAALRSWGFADVVDLGIASDSAKTLELALTDAFLESNVDLLITTGGVSMGETDLLKPTIERALGGCIHFGRVNMKPGKPTTFATLEMEDKQRAIFALPGNPASAMVTFHLFVLPALRLMSGYGVDLKHPDDLERGYLPELPRVDVTIDSDLSLDPRPEYHRVHVAQRVVDGKPQLVAVSTGFQRSSRVGSMVHANALLCLPSSKTSGPRLVKGSTVKALLIGQIGVDQSARSISIGKA